MSNWQNIDWAQKLSSRKFWAFVAGFVTSIMIAFRFNEEVIVQVTAIIGALGALVMYLYTEGKIDTARASRETYEIYLEEGEEVEE